MDKKGWKKIFDSKVLGPWIIGGIIILVSSAIDSDKLGWVGIGFALVGWYFFFRDEKI